jgi:hypothetical protein
VRAGGKPDVGTVRLFAFPLRILFVLAVLRKDWRLSPLSFSPFPCAIICHWRSLWAPKKIMKGGSMRRKIMLFVCVLFLFAGAAALYAEEGGALPAGAVLSFAPEFHESGFRLSAQGGYLWSLGRLRVGGGVAVDYGLRTCDLWVNPFAEAEFFGVLYARAGLAALVYPRVAAESYYTVSAEPISFKPRSRRTCLGTPVGKLPLAGETGLRSASHDQPPAPRGGRGERLGRDGSAAGTGRGSRVPVLTGLR